MYIHIYIMPIYRTCYTFFFFLAGFEEKGKEKELEDGSSFSK